MLISWIPYSRNNSKHPILGTTRNNSKHPILGATRSNCFWSSLLPVVIFLFSFPCWHNKQDEKKTSKKSKAKNFELIDHNTITERHLNESKLHFNKRGTTILSNNFTETIPDLIQWLSIIHSLNDRRGSGRFTGDKYTDVSALMKKKLGIFVDLSKAVNTVDHEILTKK